MALHARPRPQPADDGPWDEFREWIIEALDVPMVVLSLVMLVLAIVELTAPLSAEWSRRITFIQTLIWMLFVAEFALSFALAPSKTRYLRTHWIVLLSLALPVLRIFRFARALRFLRTFRATRLFLLANRGVNQVAGIITGNRFAYLALITLIVNAVGAAGMFFLENGAPRGRIDTFGDALWWALGSFTQLSHEAVPVTPEGRGWAILIQLINLALAGYLTAVIASYLVDKDRRREFLPAPADPAEASPAEVAELRARVDRVIQLLERREER